MATTPEVRQLSEVSRNTNTVVTQFRQASNDNTKNMSKIVKDLSSVFRSQKIDISSLNSSIDENVTATNKTAIKVDQTNNLMQESINIQNRMLSEIRNLARTVKEGNVSQKEQNMSLMEKITNLLTGAAAKTVLGVGAAGALAKAEKDYDPNNLKPVSDQLPSERINDKNLKDDFFSTIIKAEGTNRNKDPYNTSLGYTKSPKPLTEMTMKEVLEWGEYIRKQTEIGRKTNSSAKGAFQIVNTTQKDAMKALNIGMDEKFSVENQKRMATWIAKTQGLRAWEGFKHHPEELKRAQQYIRDSNNPENKKTEKDSGNLESYKDELFKLGGGRTGNIENVSNLNSELKTAIIGALKEYKEATGKTATITSGFRTAEDQAAISSPYMKAKPGTSRHEKGSAIDINSDDARLMDQMGILSKYGLHRPHGEKDPVHIELMSSKSSGQAIERNFETPTSGSSRAQGAEPIGPESLRRSSPFMNFNQRSMMPSFPGMPSGAGASPVEAITSFMGGVPSLSPFNSMLGLGANILGNLISQNNITPIPYNKNTSSELKPTADSSPSLGKILENMSKEKETKEAAAPPTINMASTMFDNQCSTNWASDVTRYYGANPETSRLIA